MASIAADLDRGSAPSRGAWRLQTARLSSLIGGARDVIERWLEAERDQLPLWLPVMVGAGVTAWFALPRRWEWEAVALGALAFAAAMLALWRGGRAGVSLAVAGVAVATGVGLAWWRAERMAQPMLARPAVVKMRGRIERVEPLPARQLVRLRVAPLAVAAVGGKDRDGEDETSADATPSYSCQHRRDRRPGGAVARRRDRIRRAADAAAGRRGAGRLRLFAPRLV